MKKGDRVVVVEYPDPRIVGVEGEVIEYSDEDSFIDVRLDLAPNPDRPWENDFLFYDQEIEVI